MKRTTLAFCLSLVTAPLAAQDTPVAPQAEALNPDLLAQLELDRSRVCVGVIARMDALEAELQPLRIRSERLLVIGEAVALEDPTIVDQLDTTDALEAAVVAWFDSDRALALRYVDEQDQAIADQRRAERDAMTNAIAAALEAIQLSAQEAVDRTNGLPQEMIPCDGAIFVRSAVLEACETTESPVCAEASEGMVTQGRFRFVEEPAGLWDIEQLRPWTDPTPLSRSPTTGQLEGARTMGYARNGNLVVSISFAPLLQAVAEVEPDNLQRFQEFNDSLGLVFDHPDIAFTPSMGVRASAPQPLAGETFYVVHFDSPEEADIVWTAPAGTGAPIDVTVALAPRHVIRLAQGAPLAFTAVREEDDQTGQAVYTIEFASINQGPAAVALLNYMARQLSTDLNVLVPPTEP